MFKKTKIALIVGLAVLLAPAANAAWFAENTKIKSVTPYHATVGTTTAAAIPSASVLGGIYRFDVCNDAVNTSTYLALGMDTDVSDDGIRLAPGQCFVCENCKPSILKLLKVEGQAADNGYSIFQYKN